MLTSFTGTPHLPPDSKNGSLFASAKVDQSIPSRHNELSVFLVRCNNDDLVLSKPMVTTV